MTQTVAQPMTDEKMREIAQMLASLCEPDTPGVGYGIYLDALRPLADEIDRLNAVIRDKDTIIALLEGNLKEVQQDTKRLAWIEAQAVERWAGINRETPFRETGFRWCVKDGTDMRAAIDAWVVRQAEARA